MNSLQIGSTTISFALIRSPKLRERRITVTPGNVDVVVLDEDTDELIHGFLHRKRQWILDTVRKVDRLSKQRHTTARFITGTSIPVRGRRVRLTVRHSDQPHIRIRYQRGFEIDLLKWSSPDQSDAMVSQELMLWLKWAVRRGVQAIVRSYTTRFGMKARSVRVGELLNGWGSCGKDGAIRINWELIAAPPSVLEYVVVHELNHLIHRNHGDEFWKSMEALLPRYRDSESWLASHGSALSMQFLRSHTFRNAAGSQSASQADTSQL